MHIVLMSTTVSGAGIGTVSVLLRLILHYQGFLLLSWVRGCQNVTNIHTEPY